MPFYKDNCFDGKLENTLARLPENLGKWSKAYHRKCQILWRKFHTIYKVDVREGGILFPKSFVAKVRSWLGGNEELMKEAYHQQVIQVNNHYSNEQTVFNLLRSKRPISNSKEDPLEYVDKLNDETKDSCDFCNYKTSTAEDVFGSYPMMVYDTLPKGGASQFHPHAHGFLATNYLSHMKVQSKASSDYKDENDSEYWNDFIEIHHALGLTVRFGDAIAVSPLTPVREHEVMIFSNQPSTDLFRLYYYVIQAYYQKVRRMCFSTGIAFPTMCPGNNKDSLPAMVRIGTRGQCNSYTNDVSSLELYLMQNVHMDPYVIIKYLQTTVDKLKETSLLLNQKIVALIEK
ncbi:hypothetical protein C0J52_00771 [Blattella germanica]|nr:hypothetical protein C0J52_00771 [Blattella germanica]